MKMQVSTKRTLPGRRPEILTLDTSVGVDWFSFGEGWCNGRRIVAEDVEMRLYPLTCVPDAMFQRDDCDISYGADCTWCYPDPRPVNIIDANWRGGWPPKRDSIGQESAPYVSCPALDVMPNGDVSFQYDDAVYDFVAKFYTVPLVGVFFLDGHPSGTVRFETDHRPIYKHIRREMNDIPDQDECDSDACAGDVGRIPDRRPVESGTTAEPECPGPYEPEYEGEEYPYYIKIEYPCDADNT